jgi:hypothetical protein
MSRAHAANRALSYLERAAVDNGETEPLERGRVLDVLLQPLDDLRGGTQ